MKHKCYRCDYKREYYKGKNKKPNCLLIAMCHHPKVEGGWTNPENTMDSRRIIVSFRCSILNKMRTRPRWCPAVKEEA